MKKTILGLSVFLVTFAIFAGNSYSEENKYIRSIEQKIQKNENKASIGKSIENPIVLPKLKTIEECKEIQNSYIEKYFPDYRIVSSGSQVGIKERNIDAISLKDDEENTITIFFDVTESMVEFSRKNSKEINEINRKRILELKSNIIPDENELGTTIDQPVVLKNITNRAEVIKNQNELFTKKYPNHQIIRKEIWFINKKFIERISLAYGEDRIIINFDVSDYIREYQKEKQVKLVDLVPGIKKLEGMDT